MFHVATVGRGDGQRDVGRVPDPIQEVYGSVQLPKSRSDLFWSPMGEEQ